MVVEDVVAVVIVIAVVMRRDHVLIRFGRAPGSPGSMLPWFSGPWVAWSFACAPPSSHHAEVL